MADTSMPFIGFETSAWYWTSYKAYANLNSVADSVESNTPSSVVSVNLTISQVVNGRRKPKGLSSPLAAYALALSVLSGEPVG
jgi:hypothetical protein